MKKLTLIVLSLCTVLSTLRGEWLTESYELKPGWNAIYNFVDASHVELDELLTAYPQVEEIWRWQAERIDGRLVDPNLTPVSGAEWAIWKRGEPTDSTFDRLHANFAYLVRVNANATAFTARIKGRATAPVVRFRTDGLNLVGFPTVPNNPPTFNNYLAPSGMNVGALEILKYVGGPLIEALNPRSVNPSFERVRRGNAYWIRASRFSRYDGPLQVELSQGSGINFGRGSRAVTAVLSNASSVNLSVSLSQMPSETAPSGEPRVAGELPLDARASATADFTSLSGGLTVDVPAGERVAVEINLDRDAMGGSAGDRFAALLKVETVSQEIYLPAIAEKTSLAGLWIGEAEITQVASVLKRYARDEDGNTLYEEETIQDANGNQLTIEGEPILVEDLTTPQSAEELPETSRGYSLRLIVHVDDAGNATLLSHVYQGLLADSPRDEPVGLTLDETVLDPAELGTAKRLSVAHLPPDTVADFDAAFAPGTVLSTTVSLDHDSPHNPYIHTYHPDHDNLNARFSTTLPPGNESFDIDRAIRLTVDAGAPDGVGREWGSQLISGVYREDITGIHKDTLRTQGPFVLYKVSSIDQLSTSD